MGYADIKSNRQHEQDAARIRELEEQLKRERASVRENDKNVNEDTPAGHVVVEKTSKKLKGQMLSSWAVLIIGIFLMFDEAGSEIGGILLLIGIVAVIVTKIQIWWRHG